MGGAGLGDWRGGLSVIRVKRGRFGLLYQDCEQVALNIRLLPIDWSQSVFCVLPESGSQTVPQNFEVWKACPNPQASEGAGLRVPCFPVFRASC